jgi:hypothetical protein
LEAGLVLLVVAIMIVAAVVYYRDNLRKTSVNTNISHLLAIASSGRSTFGQTNQYANVTCRGCVEQHDPFCPARWRGANGHQHVWWCYYRGAGHFVRRCARRLAN